MPSLQALDDYLSLALRLDHISPLTLLASFFLVMARILPIMVLAPFFGGKNLPTPVKIMFGICITAIVLPQVLFNLKGNVNFDLFYTALFIKELFIGIILGFLVALPFYIAQSSGGLIDHIRGSASLQVTDPTTKTQTSPIGIFYNYTLIVVFFLVNGPFLFIAALATSYQLIPINKLLSPLFFSSNVPFWHLIAGLINKIFTMAIQLGAPSIIGILMAEMFLGIANRLAPRVQIVFLGISLKSWVGLALLTTAWIFIIKQLGKESITWIKIIENTLEQAAKSYIT